MLKDNYSYDAEAEADVVKVDDIGMKGPGLEGSNHKLARLLAVVKEFDEATSLVGSHKFKVAAAPSCSEDVKAVAGVGTVVVGHKKDDNFTEGAADGIDWRVCKRVVQHYYFFCLRELLAFYAYAEHRWFAGRFQS